MKFVYAVAFLVTVASGGKEHTKTKSHTHVVAPKTVHQHGASAPKATTTRTCPEGYWLEQGRCVSKSEVPFVSVCPSGTVQTTSGCVSYAPVRYTCPEGGSLEGADCVSAVTAAKEFSCAPGFVLVGGQCEMAAASPATCPDGTAVVGNQCARFAPVQKRCPQGYSPNGCLCSRVETAESYPTCPNGFTADGVMCKVVTEVPPVCPPGTVDEGGSQCVTYAPKSSRCPPGFTAQSGNACVQSTTAPRNARCANGMDPNDKCRQTVYVPEAPVCPPGTEMVGDQCTRKQTSPAQFSCPSEYVLQGNKCMKTMQYDCSTTTYEVECEEVVRPSKEGHAVIETGSPQFGSSHRHLGEKHSKSAAKSHGHVTHGHTHTHAKPAHTHTHHAAPLLPVCKKVPVVNQRMCDRTVDADATPFCPTGTFNGASGCLETVYEQPGTKCGGRTDANGSCYVEEVSMPLYECPPGYNEGAGNTCVQSTYADLLLECPPNTVGPDCATYAEKRCPAGGCTKSVSEPAVYHCPEGYVKTTTETRVLESMEKAYSHGSKATKHHHNHNQYATMSKATCSVVQYAPQVVKCPSGYEPRDSTTCAAFSPMDFQSNTYNVPAIVFCPPGYMESNRQCVLSTALPATPVCPNDYTVDGTRCARLGPLLNDCPEGSVSEKGTCWVFTNADTLTVDTVVAGSTHHHQAAPSYGQSHGRSHH